MTESDVPRQIPLRQMDRQGPFHSNTDPIAFVHVDILGLSPTLFVSRDETAETVEFCRRIATQVVDEMMSAGDWRPA